MADKKGGTLNFYVSDPERIDVLRAGLNVLAESLGLRNAVELFEALVAGRLEVVRRERPTYIVGFLEFDLPADDDNEPSCVSCQADIAGPGYYGAQLKGGWVGPYCHHCAAALLEQQRKEGERVMDELAEAHERMEQEPREPDEYGF